MNKIKLQYLWVENFSCYHNANINFSEKYYFYYDIDNNTLKINEKPNKRYIDNFFGENVDLTAVVGQNGSGKTTLLKLIMQILNSDSNNSEIQNLKFIIAFEKENNENELIAYYSEAIIEKLQANYNHISFSPIKDLYAKTNLRCIYYSNVYDFSLTECENNISSGYLLKESKNNNLLSITEYENTELEKQLYFLYENKKVLADFNIRFPETISFSFIGQPQFLKYYYSKYYNNYKIKVDQLDDIEKEIGVRLNSIFFNASDIFKDIFIIGQKMNWLNLVAISLFESIILNLNGFDEFISLLKKTKSKLKSESTGWDILYSSIKEDKFADILKSEWKIIKINKSSTRHQNLLIEFMECFKAIYEKIEANEYSENNEYEVLLNFDEALNLFQKYIPLKKSYNFLHFNMNLSSGEIALLTVYSRLYFLLITRNDIKYIPKGVTVCRIIENSLHSNYKQVYAERENAVANLIIEIDEADMLLHPEWQQNFLKSFVQFVKTIFQNVNVQIIIATHSPIMLSDIPRQNIVYLHRNNEGLTVVDLNENHSETFGANIFQLFNDAFFLEKGAIGKLAEKKISDLIQKIRNCNEKTDDINEIEREIKVIGDSFLRSHIEKIFCDKVYGSDRKSKLRQEIKNMQAELKALEDNEEND